jgi:hypothetical protein
VTPAFARLQLITGQYDDLLSLQAWLAGEDTLRGRVILERHSSRGNRMGTVGDVLVVALGAGGAVTVLARSMPAWLLRHADVTVEVRAPDGRTVQVSANGVPDAQAVIQAALNPTNY